MILILFICLLTVIFPNSICYILQNELVILQQCEKIKLFWTEITKIPCSDTYKLLNEYRNFNSVAKINNAPEMLDELIIKFLNLIIDEYKKSYRLLKNWRTEIINSFHKINEHVISNGGLERANRDIKTIIRHAYGYTNFPRERTKIMYVKNKNAPIKS